MSDLRTNTSAFPESTRAFQDTGFTDLLPVTPTENPAMEKPAGPQMLVIHGTPGDDVLDGTAEADEIYGDAGNDTINGGDGNDFLDGEAGNDTVHGGNGDDRVGGGEGDDTLYGDAGNDTVLGWHGNDRMYGGEGDDTLYGGDGSDIIYGGAGKDFASGGTGNDRIFGNDGDDYLEGAEGNDIVSGGEGNDRVGGGVGNDILLGGNGNDTLEGAAGNDRLFGEAGDDTLIDYEGQNTLNGGAGNDIIKAGNDNTIIGGAGKDIVTAGANNTLIYNNLSESAASFSGADQVTFSGNGNTIDLGPILKTDVPFDQFTWVDGNFTGKPGEVRLQPGDGNSMYLQVDSNGDGQADMTVIIMLENGATFDKTNVNLTPGTTDTGTTDPAPMIPDLF